MTRKDAMMFPIIASCALFGLYIFFHIFSKEYINLLLSFYFLVLGIFALSHMMSPVILKLVPSAVPVIPFHLKFTQVRKQTWRGDDVTILVCRARATTRRRCWTTSSPPTIFSVSASAPQWESGTS